jgi:hypothetical protein
MASNAFNSPDDESEDDESEEPSSMRKAAASTSAEVGLPPIEAITESTRELKSGWVMSLT